MSNREDAMEYRDDYDRDRRYRGEGYYGREDRGFFERAGDEVRSWFGNEDAQRRRERDERDEPHGWGGPSQSWSERGAEGRGGEGRGRGGRWQYRDLDYREPQWTSPPQRYGGPSWTRESGYG